MVNLFVHLDYQKYPQVFEFDTDGAFDVEEGEINDDIEIVRAKNRS
jgi:hypothetical protein